MTAATGLLRRVLPGEATIDLAAPEARALLGDWYASDGAVRINMVTSLTGAATGADGTSDSLTNRADRLILTVIRAAADVVVVGAQSVRAEGYVVPRTARLAVVTRTGDLSGHRLSPGGDPVIVLCPAPAADRVRAATADIDVEVVPLGDGDDVSPAAAVAHLTQRGLGRIVCEGGPTLASAFVSAGVVDELCVTVAPVVGPAEAPFLQVDAPVASSVRSLAVDDAGFTYLRLGIAGT